MYETDIIRYIAKYGMCNELFEIENPDGGFSNVTLVEAVNVELTSESISFSVPAFKKIFDRALSFLPDFYADLPGEADRLDKEMREKVQIAQLSDTVVGKAKERLVESIQKDFRNKLIDFEKEYLEKRLCSDQDDEIRQTTLDLVIEKSHSAKCTQDCPIWNRNTTAFVTWCRCLSTCGKTHCCLSASRKFRKK